MSRRVLFLSYDGMTDALGESQVLSYLTGLSKKGNQITLISFEKPAAFSINKNRIERICVESKIKWVHLKYTSRPPIVSTLYDIYRLKKAVEDIDSFDIVHCRGYITSFVGLWLKRVKNKQMIFDMRGFWADEKLESGNWSSFVFKPVYQYFKKKEQAFFKEADFTVSLTEMGKKEIVSNYEGNPNKIGTIPTCVNQEIFSEFDLKKRLEIRKNLEIGTNGVVLVYSGSIGANYDINILLDFFKIFVTKYKNSRLLILSKVVEMNFPELNPKLSSKIIHKSLPYHEVPSYLMAADVGFTFYNDGYSLIGRYPTKFGEYWSCGLPIIVRKEIGDTRMLLDEFPEFGFYYFSKNELQEKLSKLNLEVNKTKMRKVATSEFSLSRGVDFYNSVYSKLQDLKSD